jgi:CheY-like chemotaxis protein
MAWRILLAHDDLPFREQASSALQKEGHSVESVDDGRAAVSDVVAEQFDLIVCGENMPHATGEQVAAVAIAARHPARFILVTDHPERFGRLPRGVDVVLETPPSIDTLLEAVAKVMD